MKYLIVAALLFFPGCGSTYHFATGGWKLGKVAGEGTCLVVHTPADPEVVRVCIAAPENLKVTKTVAEELCGGIER